MNRCGYNRKLITILLASIIHRCIYHLHQKLARDGIKVKS